MTGPSRRGPRRAGRLRSCAWLAPLLAALAVVVPAAAGAQALSGVGFDEPLDGPAIVADALDAAGAPPEAEAALGVARRRSG